MTRPLTNCRCWPAIVLFVGATLAAAPARSASAGGVPAPPSFTLEVAVAEALRSSKLLRIAEQGVLQARGAVAERRAASAPGVAADVEATQRDRAVSAALPGIPGEFSLAPGSQRVVGITAAQTLDISGMIRSAVQQAHFEEIAARLEYERIRNQVVRDVKLAYFDILRARAMAGVAEQTLQNARERRRTAEHYFEAGSSTRVEILQSQTGIARAQQAVIVAQNRVRLAAARLNETIGRDQNLPVETVEAGAAVGTAPPLEAAIAAAQRQRPEALQGEALLESARKGITLARRSGLPSMDVGIRLAYTPDTTVFTPRPTSWSAQVRLSVPLLDQGLSRARTQQARAGVASAELRQGATLDALALEVRQAHLQLTEARERLAVAGEALKQADEQYRLAQIRYEEGVTQVPGTSPALEVSDAQTALMQAQNNELDARYDLQTAWVRLEYALGVYGGSSSPRMADAR